MKIELSPPSFYVVLPVDGLGRLDAEQVGYVEVFDDEDEATAVADEVNSAAEGQRHQVFRLEPA